MKPKVSDIHVHIEFWLTFFFLIVFSMWLLLFWWVFLLLLGKHWGKLIFGGFIVVMRLLLFKVFLGLLGVRLPLKSIEVAYRLLS